MITAHLDANGICRRVETGPKGNLCAVYDEVQRVDGPPGAAGPLDLECVEYIVDTIFARYAERLFRL